MSTDTNDCDPIAASHVEQANAARDDLARQLQALQTEHAALQQAHAKTRAYLESQIVTPQMLEHHQALCRQIYDAAITAGLRVGVGACGNGGIPTFGAIVNSSVAAMQQYGHLIRLLARVRANHPDARDGQGVRQMASGAETKALWAEVDAALVAAGV